MKSVVIIGCGDLGRRVAWLALEHNIPVSGLVRSEASAAKLAGIGVTPLIGNLDDPATLPRLGTAGATVFYFAPPPGGGFIDPRVRNFCAQAALEEPPERIVYISTSGVYGDCGGERVTEETPVNPQTSRARRRYDAECFLREWTAERKSSLAILRVTGIYGPGRLPISQLASGHPLLREEECSLTNRIHVDDLARVCIAAAEKGEDGDIFNVSDGVPGTITEYFNACADLLGYPRPQQITKEEADKVMTPLMLSYIGESRSMDNRKMREKLGIELLYPNLAAGLKACREET